MRNVAFWHAAYGKWYEEGKSEANGGIAPTGDVLKLVEAYDRMKAACGPDRELSLIHIYVGLSEWQLSLVNATASVASLLSVGLWARLNEKGSVERTFPFGVAGLMGSSISMVAALCLPAALRPGAFIVMQTVSCYFQGCITLCVVQMLLKSVPEENKALCISLYTIAITPVSYTHLDVYKRQYHLSALPFAAGIGRMRQRTGLLSSGGPHISLSRIHI